MLIKSIKHLLTCFLTLCYFLSYAQNIPYRNLFDDRLMPNIYITIRADSLDWLYQNVSFDGNLRASLFIFDDGTKRDTMRNVGFRLRGNTSRGSAKKSFKIKFNAFTSGIKYQGVKELNLNGQHNDPTLVREKLFYDVWNRFGLPPRRASFSKVYINDNYFGLYTSIEEMDDEWLKFAYGKNNDTGNLYKCTYPADLKYINDSQASYKNIVSSTATRGRAYDLKTNELADDYSAFIRFVKLANNAPLDSLILQLPTVLNVDLFLKAYAVEVCLGHWDDYGYNKNNYFLYHNPQTNLFDFISYDPDNSFGVDWVGKDWGTRNIYTWHTPTSGPIIDRVLKVPYFKNQFALHVKRLLDEVIPPTIMNPRIDSLRVFITAAALSDPYRVQDWGFSANDFRNNFETTPVQQAKYGLKGFLATRATNTRAQLGIISTTPSVSKDLAVSIAPNPASQALLIHLDKPSVENWRATLLDLQGRVLRMQTTFGDKMSMDTEGVVSGFYVLKIQFGEKSVVRKVLITNL